MTLGLLNAAGGLGVFLLGMIVMTNGLKAITGEALRKALARFTNSPTSGAVTGAVSTALIQSSSATTVTAVGFVGAGLISFSQALGIIFGANIGTTITGWLVAIVGFKLELGMLALPLVLVGVLMHLFLRRRLSAFGLALAGFGLIFVGIDLIQQGMTGLEGIVTPDTFPGDDLAGRILLLLIGVGITLVTQSSSAGVAAALTAVHAGTISFDQAAVMVIGMDVGTTVTAALATIGGSNDVRRTGFAHVLYNMLTGVMAFLLVSPYSWACSNLFPESFVENPEIALVGFHTFFNTLGVLLVLPFTGAFSRLIISLFPDQPLKFVERLDRSLYQSPAIALEAAHLTLNELASVLFDQVVEILSTGPSSTTQETLAEVQDSLQTTRDYITPIETSDVHEELYLRKLNSIYTMDHLQRLIDRCQESGQFFKPHLKELKPIRASLQATAERARVLFGGAIEPADLDDMWLDEAWQRLDLQANQSRRALIAEAAVGQANTVSTIHKLDALRWIHRVAYHIWRIVFYSTGGQSADLGDELHPDRDSISDAGTG